MVPSILARIRTIKPDFWTDEHIVDLADPWHRLLFIGLWNFADDQGYLDYKPKKIKMQVFPGDNMDVSRGLQRLISTGRLDVYESPSGLLLHIRQWARHQRVSNPGKARYEASELHKLESTDPKLASPTEDSVRKGREGKGIEGITTELPSSTASPSTESVTDPPLFIEFWNHYPRKVGKERARKEWTRAIRKANPADIVAGALRYSSDPNLPEPQYIPHPAKWLADCSWDNPAEVARTVVARNGHASNGSRPSTTDRAYADALNLGRQMQADENRRNGAR